MSYTPEQKKAIEQVVEFKKSRIPAMEVDAPSFLSRDVDEVIQEKTKITGTAIEVTIKLGDETGKLYFFIDESGEGKYYNKIGPEGQPEGKGVTAQELRQSGITIVI